MLLNLSRSGNDYCTTAAVLMVVAKSTSKKQFCCSRTVASTAGQVQPEMLTFCGFLFNSDSVDAGTWLRTCADLCQQIPLFPAFSQGELEFETVCYLSLPGCHLNADTSSYYTAVSPELLASPSSRSRC